MRLLLLLSTVAVCSVSGVSQRLNDVIKQVFHPYEHADFSDMDGNQMLNIVLDGLRQVVREDGIYLFIKNEDFGNLQRGKVEKNVKSLIDELAHDHISEKLTDKQLLQKIIKLINAFADEARIVTEVDVEDHEDVITKHSRVGPRGGVKGGVRPPPKGTKRPPKGTKPPPKGTKPPPKGTKPPPTPSTPRSTPRPTTTRPPPTTPKKTRGTRRPTTPLPTNSPRTGPIDIYGRTEEPSFISRMIESPAGEQIKEILIEVLTDVGVRTIREWINPQNNQVISADYYDPNNPPTAPPVGDVTGGINLAELPPATAEENTEAQNHAALHLLRKILRSGYYGRF